MPADWPSTNKKPLLIRQGLLGDSILYLETLNQSQGDSYHALAVVGSGNMHCTTISRWSPARLQWGHHLSAVETPSAWATSPASSTGFNEATAFRQWKHARSAVGTVGFGSASMGPPPFGSGNQNPPPLGQVVCLASMGPPLQNCGRELQRPSRRHQDGLLHGSKSTLRLPEGARDGRRKGTQHPGD